MDAAAEAIEGLRAHESALRDLLATIGGGIPVAPAFDRAGDRALVGAGAIERWRTSLASASPSDRERARGLLESIVGLEAILRQELARAKGDLSTLIERTRGARGHLASIARGEEPGGSCDVAG